MYMLQGVSSVANFITAYEVSIKLRLPFSDLECSLFPKATFLTFILKSPVDSSTTTLWTILFQIAGCLDSFYYYYV